MLWPREAGRFISEHAKDVKICPTGVSSCSKAIVEAVKQGNLSKDAFLQNEVLPLDKNLSLDQLSNWSFLIDALNFNFWTQDGLPKYTVKHNGKYRKGYLAMVNAVNRAIDEGKPMYDPNYYSKLTVPEINKIFRSNTKSMMPLMDKRAEVMHEVGKKLIDKYDGNFTNVLKLSNGKALSLVKIVTEEFPCFRDVHFYEGQEVALFKRAQILASDLWMLYRGEGLGAFDDIDDLTMFADYRVPQSLVYFGAMEYSQDLKDKLEVEHLFESGERQEVEIRGVSIQVTELVVEECNKTLREMGIGTINSVLVDYFLWDFRVKNAAMLEKIPYHRTRCIYY